MWYRILELYDVCEYQVTQYNPETGEGGLFVAYINTFLKLKAEAKGYPGWVHISDDDDRYVDLFWQSEGIRLDKEAIRYNGVWSNSCFNSMWGKLTERNDRTMTKTITVPKDL